MQDTISIVIGRHVKVYPGETIDCFKLLRSLFFCDILRRNSLLHDAKIFKALSFANTVASCS